MSDDDLMMAWAGVLGVGGLVGVVAGGGGLSMGLQAGGGGLPTGVEVRGVAEWELDGEVAEPAIIGFRLEVARLMTEGARGWHGHM